MNGANHVALIIGQALIVDLVQRQLPVLLRHGHFHHEAVALESAVPESFDKPSFIGKTLQGCTQIAPGLRPKAEGELELATEGAVEMQQVELVINGDHQVVGGVDSGAQHLLRLLSGEGMITLRRAVNQGSPQPLYPFAGFQGPARQRYLTNVLPRGYQIQRQGEGLPGADTATEQGAYPALAGLAVEKCLFGCDFAAGS